MGVKTAAWTAFSNENPLVGLTLRAMVGMFRCRVSPHSSFRRWIQAVLPAISALTLPAEAYVNGDRVQAVQAVNVRDAPAGSMVVQRLAGDLGTITGGPVTAILGSTSYVWYQVDWDTGGDGWSFTGGLGAAPLTPLALVYGIDVSRWQTSIDWPAVYAAGKRFAFCKATEGTAIVDSWFTVNALNGRAAGVLMGFYHFARPLENDPISEARHFVKTAAPYLIQGNLVPVLDLESGEMLGRTALSTWARQWLTEVERLSQLRPIIYINRNFAANYMTSDLAAYPLWIAVPGFAAGAPVAGIGAWSDWTFQQYSWTGRLGGIGGGTVDTDLNAFRGTVADLVPYQIPAAPPAGFALWTGLQGLSGPAAAAGADPDGDGADNLTEYAFDTLPRAGASRPLTTLTPQPDGTVVFAFERPRLRPDLLWTIQQSDGLTGWAALAAATGDTPFSPSGVTQTGSGPWQIRVFLPAGGTGARFLRLRVERNPAVN